MTLEEDPRLDAIDRQLVAIFEPDAAGRPTKHKALADRLDMLESRCYGTNSFRGEGE